MVVLVRFTVFWIHGGLGAWGARNSVPPLTGTPTLGGAGLKEPKRLRSFGNDPLWDLNPAVMVWPIHGGFEAHLMAVWVRITSPARGTALVWDRGDL